MPEDLPKFDLSGWERLRIEPPAPFSIWKKPTEPQQETQFRGRLYPAVRSGFDGLICAYSPGLFRDADAARAWASGPDSGRLLSIDVVESPRYVAILRHARVKMDSIYTATVSASDWRLELNCPEFATIHVPELGRIGLREVSAIQQIVLEEHGTIPRDPVAVQALRNQSEDRRWDAEFPASPLARLRRHIRELTATL